MTLPLHPSLMEHYLPRSLEPPQAPRAPEEPDGPRSKPLYSEGEESDGGERSEGELVVLTDWHRGGMREQGAVRWNVRVFGASCFQMLRAHRSEPFAFPRLLYVSGDDNVEGWLNNEKLVISKWKMINVFDSPSVLHFFPSLKRALKWNADDITGSNVRMCSR